MDPQPQPRTLKRSIAEESMEWDEECNEKLNTKNNTAGWGLLQEGMCTTTALRSEYLSYPLAVT